MKNYKVFVLSLLTPALLPLSSCETAVWTKKGFSSAASVTNQSTNELTMSYDKASGKLTGKFSTSNKIEYYLFQIKVETITGSIDFMFQGSNIVSFNENNPDTTYNFRVYNGSVTCQEQESENAVPCEKFVEHNEKIELVFNFNDHYGTFSTVWEIFPKAE